MERIRSEAKIFAEKLRSQQNTEEAYRITGIVKELTEGIEEGWKQTGLDAWISYFNKETVSFLDYFDPEQSMIFLDEPLRLKEQGEAVELEFRGEHGASPGEGLSASGADGALYPVREILAKTQRKDTVYLTGLEQKLPGMTTEARFSLMSGI